jgi:hypothetical protein
MAHQDIDVSSNGIYVHDFHTPSRHRLEMWNGWVIGSYVYARLTTSTHDDFPWNQQSWTTALLIDVWKDAIGITHFVVAPLYTRNMVVRHGGWLGLASLLGWPHKFKYVLSNQLRTVDECQLRTWRRSSLPSVAESCIFNSRTSRLERTDLSYETEIARALDFKQSFPRFLQLPREIRDCIYEIALLDEHQQASRSRIYARSILRSRDSGEKAETFCVHSTPALGPLPSLQTPGILRVSRKVRQEALQTVHRTKILVITITSVEDVADLIAAKRLPEIGRFLHVRLELVLFSATSRTVRRCLHNAVTLLRFNVLSPRFLQITIGHSHLDEYTKNSERTYMDMLVEARKPSFLVSASKGDHHGIMNDKRMIPSVIANGMCDFALLCHEAGREGPLHVSWGVSEDQKMAGDYSCVCTYLCAAYLDQLWRRMYTRHGTGNNATYKDLVLSEERCQHMGCRYHRC